MNESNEHYKGHVIRGRLLGVMHYIFIPKDETGGAFADIDSDELIKKIKLKAEGKKIVLLFHFERRNSVVEVDNIEVIAPHCLRTGESQSIYKQCHGKTKNPRTYIQPDVPLHM